MMGRLAWGGLGCGLLAVSVSGGALVNGTFQFTAAVSGGMYDGLTATGTCTYPISEVFLLGESRVTPANGLGVSLSFFGQEFAESDDADYDFYPELWFQDGVPARFNFQVSEEPDASNPRPIAWEGVFNFWIKGDLVPESEGSRGPVAAGDSPSYRIPIFVNVPEPSGVVFALVSGLGLGAFVLHRRRGFGTTFHELLVRRADIPVCQFGRLSSRPGIRRARKPGGPAGWKACPTLGFMVREQVQKEPVALPVP